MEFGIQFFPAVGPDQKPADQYWREALELTQLAERLGFTNVRTVEHYFLSYGGYSPDPLIFLSAAAAVTRSIRLITGAVLPVFNNPLKLAGQIGMVDAISGGRLEVGFARAFLPHEFARFGISMDESRARFDEGLEQVRRLLEDEKVTARGRFYSFENATSLPRPTQKPRPPFWIAALSTKESFENAGTLGHYLIGIPLAGAHMASLLQTYRDAWTAAGHGGCGKVMLAFHMYCADTSAKAAAVAREPLNQYLKSIVTHQRVPDAIVREAVEAIATSGGELGRLNPLFIGMEELLEPLRSRGAATLEFGGVPLHPGALRAYRTAGLLT